MASDVPWISHSVIVPSKEQNKAADRTFWRHLGIWCTLLISLFGVSVWWVKMPAGPVTGPRRFRTVLDRHQVYRLNIFFNRSTSICLLWPRRQTSVVKVTHHWTLRFAHRNCVMSNIHSRSQINGKFYTMTKWTYDHPYSLGDAERYAQRWNHSDHWQNSVQTVLQMG